MARSTHIYVLTQDQRLVAAFTVKRECRDFILKEYATGPLETLQVDVFFDGQRGHIHQLNLNTLLRTSASTKNISNCQPGGGE